MVSGSSGRTKRSRQLRWLNVWLIVVMSAVLLDKHLEPREVLSTISEAVQHQVRSGTRYHSRTSYWVVVKLDNGMKFQTERLAKAFPKGLSVHVRSGAVFNSVQAYRIDLDGQRWVVLETESEQFKPMPYAVLVLSIVLLAPWWSMETSWLIQGMQLTILVAWLFMLFGTGILVRLS